MAELRQAQARATIPAQDAERARSFYEDKLGFTVAEKSAEGGFYFEAGQGTSFYVFASQGKASGDHTQLDFEVDDLEATVADLRSRGVTFEQYDMEGFKTDENGIVDMGSGEKGAWFKDTEGNLIAIGSRPK